VSASICLSSTMISSAVILRCFPATWTTANSRPASPDNSCCLMLLATDTGAKNHEQIQPSMLQEVLFDKIQD
jgi:hypothetical protein